MKNKINVNISPNPLDLQTLHCSQNDTEERKFYFTLHNNGEVIDTTDISDPIFEPFSVYKGGTEQLLPVNTDDPTTSPIIADIQYPDEEKTEQEFTYRESPTTLDGNAIVEKLYGNTLVWNQIAELPDTYSAGGITVTKNGDGSLTINGTATGEVNGFPIKSPWVNGHIYLWTGFPTGVRIYNQLYKNSSWVQNLDERNKPPIRKITSSADANRVFSSQLIASGTSFNNITYFPMEFDLTQMFGSTKAEEILAMEQSESGSGVAYFRSLFPLNYYSYGQKLLSFNGTGIKTVGFNQWDEEWEEGFITPTSGENASWSGRIRSKNYIPLLQGERYYFNIKNNTSINNIGLVICYYDANKTYISGSWVGGSANPYESPANASYMRFAMGDGYGSATYNHDICINISSSENGKYEPYTSSTTSIPTLTYFPTGMKSVGNVFDELTNSKAVTRVGEVDLGSLTWNGWVDNGSYIFYASITDKKANRTNPCICPLYEYNRNISVWTDLKDKQMTGNPSNSAVYIRDSSYTDVATFKTAMDGVMLQYELATEEVTNFTQASLICEDGESTLYQDAYGLVCDCTEDFSKDSGFKDCKIKFTNDDGVVYSNKIQLHIERKP